MKGLLVKDMRLTLQRRQTLLIFIVISLVMSISMDGSFIVTYVGMLMGITAVGTISYDEFDNGYPFLFSLPIDCRTYVAEKYIFCFLMNLIGIVFGTAVMFGAAAVKNMPVEMEGLLAAIIITVCVLMIICSVMIYIQLKYGSEKSRTAMLVIYGIVAVIAFLLKGAIAKLEPQMASFISYLNSLQPWVIAAVLLAVTALICYGMYLISVRMLSRKEF